MRSTAAAPGRASASLVLGYGPIGACTALVARALGLESVVYEPHAGRRARAEAHGFEAARARAASRASSPAPSARRTGGGAEIVVDCSGAVPALEAAMEMTRRGGRVVIAGIPKKPVPVDPGRMVLYERSLIGTLGYANDLPRVARMIASGAPRPERDDHQADPARRGAGEIERLASEPARRRQGPGRTVAA